MDKTYPTDSWKESMSASKQNKNTGLFFFFLKISTFGFPRNKGLKAL